MGPQALLGHKTKSSLNMGKQQRTVKEERKRVLGSFAKALNRVQPRLCSGNYPLGPTIFSRKAFLLLSSLILRAMVSSSPLCQYK
jgi:hypothetical protein